ncbi:MAG: phytanoyl-CoA dioxygenase family protein [Enhygromyxa sp.]
MAADPRGIPRGIPRRILADPSVEEIEAWLTQQVQDQLGTYAYLLRAVAWARRGAYARARADVDAALARVPAYELVEVIGALILYVTRDYDRALTLLSEVAARHKYLAAQTLRVLEARAARLGWVVERRGAQERLAALGVRDLRAHIHELQRARAGGDPSAPEQLGAHQLWATLEHAPEQLGAQLDALLERAPTVAKVRRSRARLHLRLGELERAATLLAGESGPSPDALRELLALARGRAAELVARPLPETASEQRLLVRAEALLEVGALEPAAELVARAARGSSRGSALAELLGILIEARARGQGPSRERFARLYALAPGLLSDAARELGIVVWSDEGVIDDPAALLRCCERARGMLTADRSPRLWYRTSSGEGEQRLRCGYDGSYDRSQAPAAHDEDRGDLEQAARLLLRAIEKPSRASSRRRVADQRSLDAEQIERFIAEGHVHLRGAFARELAEAVVSGAQQRLREQPERWLQGELAASLRGYDPADPQTWPEGRVDLLGDRRFAIAEFSPYCARAITRLLGGAQRVRTRSWSNSSIIQFPIRSELETIKVAPARDWQSWHIDAPHTHTRLDTLGVGLLVFILYSDLAPSSGNTWLALDSPGKVARALAANPAGMDFCRLDTAPAITRECERLFELTGEAGDIVLVHPLMLHSASPNPSPRVRWLGNPMIYVEGVLDHRRADASPVELAIARALERSG